MKLELFFIFLLTFSYASALDIQRDTYSNKETLIATINEENFQPSKILLKDNSSQIINIGTLSYKTDSKTKIYFNIPSELKEGEYTLFYDTDSAKFKVKNGSSISIKPVFIKPKNLNSKIAIELKNNINEPITIEVSSLNKNIIPVRRFIEIPGLEKRSLFVNLKNPDKTSVLSLTYDNKEYLIDIIIIKNEIENPKTEIKKNGLEFTDNSPIIHEITNKQTIQGPIEFRNILDTKIESVSFHLTPRLANIIDFRNQSYTTLNPHSTYEQYIWINKDKRAPIGRYNGTLLIQSRNGDRDSLYIDVTISQEIIERPQENINITETEENTTTYTNQSTIEISEINTINGTFIGDIQVVNNSKKENNKNILLGIIILLIIICLAGIIIWKLRPQEKKLQFHEYINPFKKGNKKKN